MRIWNWKEENQERRTRVSQESVVRMCIGIGGDIGAEGLEKNNESK